MNQNLLYDEVIWNEFVSKINSKNKPKTYLQFDHIYDFVNSSDKIKNLVKDPSLRKIADHSFIPHIKIITKTPRYKFDSDIEAYDLETKIRPISFASHFDSYIYSFFAYSLNQKYQHYIKHYKFDPCVLAYRSDLNGDCNIQFAKKAFDTIKDMVAKYGQCKAIVLDISGYFDNIDHQLLKEKWCKILGIDELPIDLYQVFKSLTKYSYVNKTSFLKHFNINLRKQKRPGTLLDLIPDAMAGPSFKDKFELIRKRRLIVQNKPKIEKDGTILKKGIPQGSPMSSVLSNIYLIDFDAWLYDLSQKMGFGYFRYCDDLLIVCKSEHSEKLNYDIVQEIKNEYKLVIQAKKTELIEFRINSKDSIRSYDYTKKSNATLKSDEERFYKNLQYLGFEFNGKNIYIRPGSLSRYFRKAKGRVLKTMMMAYGKKSKHDIIFKKQIYFRYSHFGERNFLTYAQNAAKKEYKNSLGIVREGLDSISIKRQLASHFYTLEKEIIKKSSQFAKSKKRPVKR